MNCSVGPLAHLSAYLVGVLDVGMLKDLLLFNVLQEDSMVFWHLESMLHGVLYSLELIEDLSEHHKWVLELLFLFKILVDGISEEVRKAMPY